MAGLTDQIRALFLQSLHIEVPSPDTDLLDTGIIDSLQLVELIANLERAFGVKISLAAVDLDHFRSIARIARFVENHNHDHGEHGERAPTGRE